MPVFVTEFGTRGRERRPSTVNDPGNFHEGSIKIPLAQSKVAAFQHAPVPDSRLQHGCVAMAKWDCHFGKYDLKKARQAYYAIGPPGPPHQPRQWQLYPMYFLLRLMTITTAPGWKVLRVKRNPPRRPARHLVALKGEGKGLTILGLDERGPGRGDPRKSSPIHDRRAAAAHTIQARLVEPSRRRQTRSRQDSHRQRCRSREDNVPLHSVFALTTKPLPTL